MKPAFSPNSVKYLCTSGLIIALLFFIAAFTPADEKQVVKKITENYLHEKDELSQRLKELALLIGKPAVKLTANTDSVKAKLLACRMAYKKTEWIVAYYYPAAATRINGTDVIEEEEPTEFEPAHGLQVLENILLADAQPDPTELQRLNMEMEKLQTNVRSLSEAVKLLAGSPASEVLAALKYELIKITTTGFTEYDNPVAKNYLSESAVALQSICTNLKMFSGQVTPALATKTNATFNKAIAYIKKHNNVNTFDRLAFISTYYMPLSKVLDEYAAALQTPYTSYNPNINLKAASIFDLRSFENFYADKDKTTHQARISLGKTLFFDPVLSVNMQRACASCHNPGKGFTDGLAKSMAFDRQETVARNSPTILNACLQTSFFGDSRVAMLETQMSEVMHNPKEFNSSLVLILSRLKQSDDYQKLFQAAFPGDSISSKNVTKAIADYERGLTSFNSNFDKYIRGDKTKLTPSQVNGFNLFMGKARCGSCHFAPLFNGMLPPLYNKSEFEIIGAVQSNDFKHPVLDTDEGVGPLKKAEHLKFGFKVPTLRNVAITAPYMHNGSFKNLADVLTFYNKGGGAGLGLTVPNQTLSGDSLGLNKQQMADIVHFLNALTDTTGLTSRPHTLPKFAKNEKLNARKMAGEY